MDEHEYCNQLIEVVLLGDCNVGKTNIVSAFKNPDFKSKLTPTIAIDHIIHKGTIDGKSIKAFIWDASGQERYRNIIEPHVRNAHGAMIVFDITKRETFDNIKNWVDVLKKEPTHESRKIIIVGNKSDLKTDRIVDLEEAESYSQKNGFEYFETSASEGFNINSVFDKLLRGALLCITSSKTEEIGTNLVSESGNMSKYQEDSETVQLKLSNNNWRDCSKCSII